MWLRLITGVSVIALWSALGAGLTAGEERRDIVTGVLEELDHQQGRGKLRTDLGKPIFFDIVKPELLVNIHVGARVTVQLDPEGRALKIIEDPGPELPPS